MSSTRFKNETPTNDVTTVNMDESAESDNCSDSNHEMDDTPSVEDQKVTAVSSTHRLKIQPLELNTPRGVAALINYFSPRKSEYC